MIPTAVAQGAVAHPFLSSFNEGAGGSPVLEPGAAAADHETGRLFVADTSAGAIDVYSGTGHFITAIEEAGDPIGVVVNETNGLVYVADDFENSVLVYAPAGETGYLLVGEWTGQALPEHQFGEVTGIAVDNSGGASAGDVDVVDGGDAVVDVFKAAAEPELEGTLLRVLSKGKMEEPNGIAIDGTTGRIYVADAVKAAVYEYSSAGTFEGKQTGSTSPLGPFGTEESEENVAGVAVDPTSGDLLVAEAERGVVEEFSAGGRWAGWILSLPEAPLGEPAGLAVDQTGAIFVADKLLVRIDRYGAGVQVPDATTEKPGKTTRTTAPLNGVVNNDGKPAEYFFQWGTSPALGSSTSPTPYAGGIQSVTTTLSALHAGTIYFYRVVSTNGNGTGYGATREFETPPAVEHLSTGPVTNLLTEGATLTGSLAPNGFDTHYYFEWGATTSYGNSTPLPPGTDVGAEKGTLNVETALAGLVPNTTYHYRLVGENEFGATRGVDARFATSGPPRLTLKPTTGVGHDVAQLNAEVNPDQLATTYHFEYGETTSYGSEAPSGGAAVGAGSTNVSVSAPLAALKLGVTYHYRARRFEHGRNGHWRRSDVHDHPAGARDCVCVGRKANGSDPERSDQPARSRHDLLLPVRQVSLPAEAFGMRLVSGPAGAGRGWGRSRGARDAEADGARTRDDLSLSGHRYQHSRGHGRPRTHVHHADSDDVAAVSPTGAPGRWSAHRTSTERRLKR